MTRATAWVDRMLGRITMYLLVIVVLAVIGVLALVLSLAGVIAIAPLAILASATVLLAASWIANEVLGIAFRTRPLTQSGVITALLLLFVLEPTTDPGGLLCLALAAAIAAASKYLVAWRGRHIVNPAAFAAGTFTQEIDVLRIEGLVLARDHARARAAADQFLSANERSPYADRVRSIIDRRR